MYRLLGQKKVTVVLSLVVVLVLCLSALAGAKTKIRFAFAVERASAPEYIAVIDKFHETHPDIEVEYTYIPGGEFLEKLQTNLAAGTPIETFYVNDRDVPAMALAGVMAPLDKLVEADTSFDRSSLFPGALAAGEYDGKLYGLPYYYGPHYLYYNKVALDESGVAYPDTETSYDDLATMARKLTTDSNNDGEKDSYGLHLQASFGWLDKLVYSHGGRFFNDDRTAFELTGEETVRGFKFYYETLISELGVIPIGIRWTDLFSEGNLGILFGYRGLNTYIFERVHGSVGVNIGMTTTPRGPAQHYMAGASAVVAMAPNLAPDRQEAAWEFLKWWTSKTVQGDIFSVASMPVTVEGLTSDGFRQNIAPWETEDILLHVAQNAHSAPVTPAGPQIQAVVSGYSNKVIQGEMAIEEALGHIEREANILWHEAITP